MQDIQVSETLGYQNTCSLLQMYHAGIKNGTAIDSPVLIGANAQSDNGSTIVFVKWVIGIDL